jgi:hypothetical protein
MERNTRKDLECVDQWVIVQQMCYLTIDYIHRNERTFTKTFRQDGDMRRD